MMFPLVVVVFPSTDGKAFASRMQIVKLFANCSGINQLLGLLINSLNNNTLASIQFRSPNCQLPEASFKPLCRSFFLPVGHDLGFPLLVCEEFDSRACA